MPARGRFRRVMGGGWKDVTPPAGWTWELPFTIQQSRRSFRVKPGWSIDQNKPTGKAYYVATDGNDANSGLDENHPLRSINTAVKKTDAKIVYVKSGIYGKSYGYINTGVINISIIATHGRVVCGAHFDTLSWIADGNAYTSALVSANTYLVTDASLVDANGDYAILTKAADAATVKATPGSWYCDGSNIWVRTSDDRVPDDNIRVYDKSAFPAALGKYSATPIDCTYYLEGFDFEGGYHAFYANGQATVGNKIYINNCTFKYASRNGFQNEGQTCYLQNCRSVKNTLDAFSAHKSGSVLTRQAEINCVGGNNLSTTDNANNGSTNHDGGQKIALMGEYWNTDGPVCHDITAESRNWYLGCKAHDSKSATADLKANFGCGNASGPGSITWLDCCQSYGSPIDIYCYTDSVVNLRSFSPSNPISSGGGTVQAY